MGSSQISLNSITTAATYSILRVSDTVWLSSHVYCKSLRFSWLGLFLLKTPFKGLLRSLIWGAVACTFFMFAHNIGKHDRMSSLCVCFSVLMLYYSFSRLSQNCPPNILDKEWKDGSVVKNTHCSAALVEDPSSGPCT